MGVELHLLHQLLGQRKDFVFGAENMINSDAASDLLEVQELYFEGQCATLEVVLLDASHKFEYRVIQVDGDGGVFADVRLKGLFTDS